MSRESRRHHKRARRALRMERRRAARLGVTEPVVLDPLEPRLLFTAAAITSVAPLANSHTAPVGTDITATYDQNIDTGGSVTDTTFVVHAMFTGQIVNPPHGNTITVVGDTITFNPDNDFKPGETVQVIATDGIENTLAEASQRRVWQFRTAASGGTAVFLDNGQNLGNHSSPGVSLGDVDGDGDLDVFVANRGLHGNRVWINGQDFGDAPDTFGTLQSSDGARHNAAGPTLGPLRDGDADGQPTAGADGDDNNGTDDEDGVTFPSPIIAGDLSADVAVNASGAALLDAWIDFNGDGTFAGANEQIFTSQPLVAGDNNLTFIVPADARQGTTFGRFRLSTSGGLDPRGAASDGEVEDHVLTIVSPMGTGDFTDSGQSLGSDSSFAVSLGDLDGDGDLDALIANDASSQPKRLWINDGAGNFTDSGQSLGDHSISRDVALGDLDGDGDLDAFVANTSGNRSNRVWLNRDPPTVTEVLVRGSGWTQAFLDHLDSLNLGTGGYSIPVGSRVGT